MVAPDHPEIPEKRQPDLVNRQEDLARLLNLVAPRRSRSSFVILTAPSGYGKTRLTVKLMDILRDEGVLAVALEPQVRAKAATSSVYQGFFVQRCAEALDAIVQAPGSRLLASTFEGFLKTERVRRAKSTNWLGALRKPPGLKMAYELGVELLDRVLNTGDHSAKKLLTSDSREAVETCARYMRHVADTLPLVFVVREAQHIDQASLQVLSEIAGPLSPHSAILEYTLDASRALNPLYVDFIEAAPLHEADWLHIVEIVRLTKPHLEELLRQTIPGADQLSGEYYLHWDGNVRAIRQLRFSISVEHRPSAPQLVGVKDGVVQEYQRQLAQLTPTDRMTMCLLFAHGEAMPAPLMPLLLGRLNTLATKGVVERILTGLIDAELVVGHPGDALGLENEDIAEAIQTQSALAGNLLLAKRALRDHYRGIIVDVKTHPTDVSLAVRQALRLSVDLGDMIGVETVVAYLSQSVITTADQSWYVSQIVAAIDAKGHLFADQQDRLLLWAAELAYEISDFRKARDLLRQISVKSPFSEALLCACLTETGDHDEAAVLVELLKMSTQAEVRLAGQLVEIILLRCTGRIDCSRELWHQLVTQERIDELGLYGYLLRFKELVADFPDCVDALRASSEWFMARSLVSSAAYTELTLASHIAREGDTKGALAAVENAKSLLTSTARDQHILLNNEAAVNLLSWSPNPSDCCDKLARGIPCSGDDYSDLVLYTNLSVSAVLAHRVDLASEAIERALKIVRSPRFADRDVFWGVSFNLKYVNAAMALGRQVELAELFDDLKPHSLQNDYWQHRRGQTSSAPDRFRYMLSKPYHPMFLSHWTIDVDGLRALSREPAPPALHTTSPSS